MYIYLLLYLYITKKISKTAYAVKSQLQRWHLYWTGVLHTLMRQWREGSCPLLCQHQCSHPLAHLPKSSEIWKTPPKSQPTEHTSAEGSWNEHSGWALARKHAEHPAGASHQPWGLQVFKGPSEYVDGSKISFSF